MLSLAQSLKKNCKIESVSNMIQRHLWFWFCFSYLLMLLNCLVNPVNIIGFSKQGKSPVCATILGNNVYRFWFSFTFTDDTLTAGSTLQCNLFWMTNYKINKPTQQLQPKCVKTNLCSHFKTKHILSLCSRVFYGRT